MSAAVNDPRSFRSRFAAGERLAGTFIKTPTTHGIEILGAVGYDFVVVDAEHAPFDRAAIDVCLLAARAAGTAGLVRVPDASAAAVGNALDCGAAGVLVPHVASAQRARDMVAAGRFRGGRRGFSGSPRSSGYGAVPLARSVDEQDRSTTLIAMIEDVEALDVIDEIAAVDGLDGLFIGRADLAVALGAAGSGAEPVVAAVRRICTAGRAAGKPICVMVGDASEAAPFAELGATAFIVSSDQGFMRKAGAAALKELAALK
ncbi:MAG: HpcH/HpaI aldolase/citrate lyase family protein [Burkholderiaceae bacterium]